MADIWVEKGWPVVAGVLLVDPRGHVLLQHRDANAPTSANRWGTPGGHVEPGETPQVAVVRELMEETGLQLAEPPRLFKHFLACSRPDGSICFVEGGSESVSDATILREISIFYAATTAQQEDLVLGEGDALAFIAPNEATRLDLATSTTYALPLFLESPEYKRLAEGVVGAEG